MCEVQHFPETFQQWPKCWSVTPSQHHGHPYVRRCSDDGACCDYNGRGELKDGPASCTPVAPSRAEKDLSGLQAQPLLTHCLLQSSTLRRSATSFQDSMQHSSSKGQSAFHLILHPTAAIFYPAIRYGDRIRVGVQYLPSVRRGFVIRPIDIYSGCSSFHIEM